MKLIPKIYWSFILLIQIHLITDKISIDDFYLWNIVALVGAMLFLINRITFKRNMKNYELILILFLIINCITTLAAEFILKADNLRLAGIALVMIASLFAMYQINRKETLKNKLNYTPTDQKDD